MERNMGDQLNKAFEAYRQVSIEKENAKKELQQKVTTCVSCMFLHWKSAYLMYVC